MATTTARMTVVTRSNAWVVFDADAALTGPDGDAVVVVVVGTNLSFGMSPPLTLTEVVVEVVVNVVEAVVVDMVEVEVVVVEVVAALVVLLEVVLDVFV